MGSEFTRQRTPAVQNPPRGVIQRQPASLVVNLPGDRFEQEADRVADAVVSGQRQAAPFSLSAVPITRVQREDVPKEKTNEEKIKDAGDKLKDAFLATPLGKDLQERVKQDKLVKGATEAGKSFIATLPGKIIAGAAAAGAVATLAATHKELPAQIPEIPLDVLTPGLSVEITYKGPVDKPTEAMITFKYSEQAPGGGGEKKPALTRAEKQRAENAVVAADQAKYRAGMKYPPGSPEDLRQKAEDAAAKSALAKYAPGPDLDAMVKKYPWLGVQKPQDGPQLTPPTPSFGYKLPSLLGDEYKLKLPGDQKKKEDEPGLQRQASSAATVDTAPPVVHEVLQSPGQPLATDIRAFMEPRFGHDFGQVRIHADARAAQSARAVNAVAYTVGRDVVFDAGQYAPNNREGRRLLAHELTHVVQQRRDGPSVHRQVYGPKATATPADWKDKVSNATTSVDRAALIQSVVSPVKVVDKTADAAADAAVDPKNCIKWDDANPMVSYDDGLNAKKGRASNAGFTKEVTTTGPSAAAKTEFYIVLGPKALDGKDRTTTTLILNHEFDHVKGLRGGSKLTGDESEIETWAATFVREFHRSYSIRERSDGVTSYIDPNYATFTQLGGYYARSTDTKVKADAVKKITDYYTATIKPHAVHDKVFRYWIHRGINKLNIAALCGDVNDALGKIVDPTKDVKDYWEMPTAIVKAAAFSGPPAVTVP